MQNTKTANNSPLNTKPVTTETVGAMATRIKPNNAVERPIEPSEESLNSVSIVLRCSLLAFKFEQLFFGLGFHFIL